MPGSKGPETGLICWRRANQGELSGRGKAMPLYYCCPAKDGWAAPGLLTALPHLRGRSLQPGEGWHLAATRLSEYRKYRKV